MDKETRQCQNCHEDFEIDAQDFQFYEKIKVPPPTFCPECRQMRRMTWRNERSLYKRKCDAPGHTEDIISVFDPKKGYKAYDARYWWSDVWDSSAYGRDYNFNVPFFTQYSALLKDTPLIALSVLNSVNSDYTNFVDGNKNCYLIFGSGWNENVSYANKIMNTKDSQDLLMDTKCELCYECVNCVESYNLFFANNCKNCNDSYFLYSCRNCSNCFGCANLVSKSYCIFNKQYSKEEYFEKLKELKLGDRNSLENLSRRFQEEIVFKSLHRYANIFSSRNCTGDNINNAKNAIHCFDIYQNVEDSKFLYSSLDLKDSYDGNGVFQNDLSYEYVDANVGNKNFACLTVYESNNLQYSWNCHSSSYLFGCVGLRNKHYCILNKQYSKEEYLALLPKVIEQMNSKPYVDRRGREYRYGEFFPTELSPFDYNETISQEYFNLDKNSAERKGYGWKVDEERHYSVTVPASAIPTNIGAVSDSILKEVLGCEHEGKCNEQCATAFKLIPQELQFYKRMNIPLPKLCSNCRHYQRLKQRNPMKLWHRQCMCDYKIYGNSIKHQHHPEGRCPNEFETSYSPERPEIVYCEQCYQAEVI